MGWFGRFASEMKSVGNLQSNSDNTLFIKQNGKRREVTTLIVYVDDIVLNDDEPEEMKKLQQYLATKFEMKDFRQLRYFLGIEVSRPRQGISLFL